MKLAFIAAIFYACTVLGADMPDSAASEPELLAQAERHTGSGLVRNASFSSSEGRVFALWWDPHADIAATIFHAYAWFPGRRLWLHCVNTRLDGTPDVSAELTTGTPATLVVRDVKGKVVLQWQALGRTCSAFNGPND